MFHNVFDRSTFPRSLIATWIAFSIYRDGYLDAFIWDVIKPLVVNALATG